MVRIFGPFSNANLPGIEENEIWQEYKKDFNARGKNIFRKKFSSQISCQEYFDLLERLLIYDPSKRLTAKEAIEHPVFRMKLFLNEERVKHRFCSIC